MKRLSKLLSAVIVMTLVFAVSVSAANPTPEQLKATLDKKAAGVELERADLLVKAWANPEGPQWSEHASIVQKDINNYNKYEIDNYITYLKGIINNKKEMERIKLEIVNNYTDLSKVNLQYADMLVSAQADYQAAVADRMASELDLANAIAFFGVR